MQVTYGGRDSVTFRARHTEVARFQRRNPKSFGLRSPASPPGAAAFGIADAFRIPPASQAVGSLLSAKTKSPFRGFSVLAEREGFEPSVGY